jgi:drug/metabolite transporter (DMT)-like permease
MLDSKVSLKALCLLLALGIIWGSGYVIARYATTHGVSPLGYSFWQSLGPAILVLLSCTARGLKLSLNRQHVAYFIVCGAIGIAIPNTNMYFAAPHLPSNILAVLVNTVPVMIYILALALGQERFHPWRLLGVVCAIAGIMLIITPRAALPTATMIPWVLLVLLSPLCFALCAIYIERYRPIGSYSLVLSAGMLVASSLMLAPIVWSKQAFYFLHWPLNQADLAVLLEIGLSSLGYVILFELLRIAGSVYYSLVGSVVVLTGLFWGWQIFDEKLNWYTCIAIFLILLAISLVTITQKKRG